MGLARSVQTAKGYLSEAGTLGTWAWSAPEVLTGQQCTVAADIYRWGRGGAGQGRAGLGWAGLQWGAVGGGQRSCSTCPTRFRARGDPPPFSSFPVLPSCQLGHRAVGDCDGGDPVSRDDERPHSARGVPPGRVGSGRFMRVLAGWWCPALVVSPTAAASVWARAVSQRPLLQEVVDLIRRCTSTEPSQRPNAKEMVQLLEALGGGGGAPGSPTAHRKVTRRPSRDNLPQQVRCGRCAEGRLMWHSECSSM